MIVVDADTDAILGAIPGTSGGEAIHTALDIMAADGHATSLRRTMHRTQPCPSRRRPSPASFGRFLRSAHLCRGGSHCASYGAQRSP